MRNIDSIPLALTALTLACGSPIETDEPANARVAAYQAWERGEGPSTFVAGGVYPEDAPDIGQLEQQYSARETANYQMGVSTGASRTQCSTTNTFQTCSVITTKAITYYIEPADFGPPGTGFNDEIAKYVDQLAAQLSPEWTFTEQFEAEPEATIHVRDTLCQGNYQSPSIVAFSCVDLDDTGVNLLENTGVVGQYKTHDDCNVNIDMDDINQRGLNSLQELRLLRHAAGGATLACIGLGRRGDGGADDFASRLAVDVNFSPAVISTGERCRAKSYGSANNGQFSVVTPGCTGAD